MSPSPFSAPGLRAFGHWLRSWLRPTVALYLPAQQPEQVFEAWCRTHPGTPVRLLLAGGLTHQCVTAAPAAPEHGNGLGSLRRFTGLGGHGDAAARARAAQDWALHYGDAAHTWPITAWRITAWRIRSGSGAGQHACVALHGASLAALRRSAQAYGVRLQSAAPLWAALLPWAAARQPQWWCAGPTVKPVPGKATATATASGTGAGDAAPAALAVVEGTLLTWVQCGPGGVRGVLQRRLAGPSAEALEQKMHSLRAPQQRVLVVGFGLDVGTASQAQPGQSAPSWQTLSPLDAPALPGPVLAALARSSGRRAARRWPQADLLHHPGSLGALGVCLAVLAWLGLVGSVVLWQQNHAAYTQAQRHHVQATASLQSARTAQRSTPQATSNAAGALRSARSAPAGDAYATTRLQARKVMAGLHYAWAGLLLPIEAAASDQVRWLELDCSTEGGAGGGSGVGPGGGPGGGRLRLLGHANTSAAALEAVQTLSAQPGWSQVVISKMQAATPRDLQGGVRFELTALYSSPPPDLAAL